MILILKSGFQIGFDHSETGMLLKTSKTGS